MNKSDPANNSKEFVIREFLATSFISVISCACVTLLSVLLTACGTTQLFPVTSVDDAYYRHKIESSLNKKNHIERICLGPIRSLHIVLKAKPVATASDWTLDAGLMGGSSIDDGIRIGTNVIAKNLDDANREAETDCMKALKGFANDLSFPEVDEVYISAQRFVDCYYPAPPPFKTVFAGNKYQTAFAPDQSNDSKRHEIVWYARITRERLLKGEYPEVLVRRGALVNNGGVSGSLLKGAGQLYVGPMQ